MASLKESLQKLNQSTGEMRQAVAQINADTTEKDGLTALTERIRTAPSIGGDTKGVVTASASVYKEDLIGVYQELKRKGDPLRVVVDDGTLLAADSVDDTVIFLFSQDDNTYIKAAKWTGSEWHLGATELFLEGPLTQGVLKAGKTANYDAMWLAVLYREEEIGCIQFWEIGGENGLTLTRRGTDLWSADSPRNICAAWTMRPTIYTYARNSKTGFLELTNRLTVVSQNAEGKIVVTGIEPTLMDNADGQEYLSATIATTKTIEAGDYPAVMVREEALEAFTVPEADGEEYQSRAWTISAYVPISGSIYITFPAADGNRYLLELYDLEDRKVRPYVTFDYEVTACKKLHLGGYMPTAAAISGLGGDIWKTGLFGGVSRTKGNAQKSTLGAEIWSGYYSLGVAKPFPLEFGEEKPIYGGNIGLVAACNLRENQLAAVGFCTEGKYKCLLWQSKGGGPAVEIADVGVAAELVTSGYAAALVYQREHSVYLQQLEVVEVVATVEDDKLADGIAITGGSPGQEIQYKGWK